MIENRGKDRSRKRVAEIQKRERFRKTEENRSGIIKRIGRIKERSV